MFSPFGEDSLPKIDHYDVKKTKYGIVDQPLLLPFVRKNEDLKMVEPEFVLVQPEEDDSLGLDEEFREELLKTDTLAMDEIEEAEEARDTVEAFDDGFQERDGQYNVDQENYERLFGEYLKKPEPPTVEEEEEADSEETDEAAAINEEEAQKKGLFGGLKGLFKKKKKKETDAEEQVEDESGATEN